MDLNPPALRLRDAHGLIGFTSPGRRWNDIDVYAVTTNSTPGQAWHLLTSEQATVAVVLEQVDGFVEPRKRIHSPTPRVRYDAGHAMYVPPNSEIWGIAGQARLTRDLRIKLNASAVENLLGGEGDRQRLDEPILLLYDERITQLAELIWQECHVEPPGSTLYGESLTAALLGCLFRSQRLAKTNLASGLGRLQLKRTIEYMQAHFLRNLQLKEIASVAELSPSQFGRAFKTSTGLTPHRWIIRRKVEFSQQLMRDSRISLAAVADIAGFATQSHFTKTFRALTGLTPRAWLVEMNTKQGPNPTPATEE